MRNLLVRPAASQQDEDFMFAGRQPRNEGTHGSDPTAPFTQFDGVQKSAFNSLQQSLFGYGLGQKVFRAGFDRLHTCWNIPIAGHEDDWQSAAEPSEMILQLRPTQAGHVYVKKYASEFIAGFSFQELRSRFIVRNSVVASAQQIAHRGPK